MCKDSELQFSSDCKRNCKGIWKRSSFYRLGKGGGNYKTKDPDFVFKVPFCVYKQVP